MMANEQILRTLKKKNLSKYGDPTELNPLGQALWVLEVAKDNANIKAMSAEGISYILSELKEIDLSEQAIANAFNRAKGKVKIHRETWLDEVLYEIMTPGRKYLRNVDTSESQNDVLFFTGKDSWSDPNKNFPKIIERLDNDLAIVDPYYGYGTFNVLEKFGKKRKIRFLTSQLGKEEKNDRTKFEINLKGFKKEFKNIEFREYDKYWELHDRYVIAKNALVIIGHGIKDLGGKESFVIYLPKNLVARFLPTVKKIFEERWRKSKLLS